MRRSQSPQHETPAAPLRTVCAALVLSAALAACSGQTLPVAEAGPDREAIVGQAVPLDGRASGGNTEDTRFAWRFAELPAGSQATLQLADSAQAWFVPDRTGVYVVSLVVRQDGVASAPDSLRVQARCGPSLSLELSAAPAEGLALGQPVSLRAAAVAPGGDCEAPAGPLAVAWHFDALPEGSEARLSQPGAAETTFTPDRPGTYRLVAEARSADGAEASGTLELEAVCGGSPPIIESLQRVPEGPVVLGQRLHLEARATDPDAAAPCSLPQPLEYRWRIVSLPAGSEASLRPATGPVVELRPDRGGTYAVELRVRDPQGLEASQTLSFELAACGERAPVIDALSLTPERASVGQPVQLAAEVSDPDDEDTCLPGSPLSLEWSVKELPPGSHAQIWPADAARPSFVPDRPGSYLLQLVVSDASGLTVSATRRVEVDACGDAAPSVALSASPAAPLTGELVRVEADLWDADLLPPCSRTEEQRVRWRFESSPAGFAAPPLPERPVIEFVADLPGEYVLLASAEDERGHRGAESRLRIAVGECGAATPVIRSLATRPDAPRIGQVTELVAEGVDPDTLAPCGQTEELSWNWTLVELPAGSQAQLQGAQRAIPQLTPDLPGHYGLRVELTDAAGHSARALGGFDVSECGAGSPLATIEASPLAPGLGEWLHLRARIEDPDAAADCGLAERFERRWTLLEAPAGLAPDALRLALDEPLLRLDLPGDYRVRLEVTDAAGHRAPPAEASFTVGACGAATPRVDSVSQTPAPARVGQRIELSAAASDPDEGPGCEQEQPLTFAWRLLAAPAGSSARLQGSAPAWWVADRSGEYEVEVVAVDPTGRRSLPFAHRLTVAACGEAAPAIAALAASPEAAALGQRVELSAQVSDADAAEACGMVQTLDYAWRFTALPLGSRAALEAPQSAHPSFVPDRAGSYEVALRLSDPEGHWTEAKLVLELGPCGGRAPSITALEAEPLPARVDRPLRIGAQVTDLDVDECGAPAALSYRWNLEALPEGSQASLLGPTREQTELVPDLPGTYRVALRVRDASGRESAPRSLDLLVDACGAAAPELTLRLTDDALPLSAGEPRSLTALLHDADMEPPCDLVQSHWVHWFWRELPAGSQAEIWGQDALEANVVLDVAGHYVVGAVAQDESGRRSAVAELVLDLPASCGDSPPRILGLVVEGPAPAVLGQPLALRATVDDPDNGAPCALGQALQPSWRLLRAPAGSLAALVAADSLSPSFVPDRAGDYEVELRVEDSTGRAALPRRLVVPALDCGASPPVARVLRADPRPVLELSSGDSLRALACLGAPFLQLDAEPSFDPDNAGCGQDQSLSYAWWVQATPAGGTLEVLRPGSRNPSFIATAPGRFEVDLQVSDSTGATSPTFRTVLDLVDVPAPSLHSVNPSFFCPRNVVLTVQGENFFVVGDERPRLLFGARELPVQEVAGCVLFDPALGVSSCTTLRAEVPADFPADVYAVRVLNPFPLGCTSTNSRQVVVAGAPSIDSVEPEPLCRGSFDGHLVLHGSGFFASEDFDELPRVTINGVPTSVDQLEDCVRVGDSQICDTARLRVPQALRNEDLLLRLSNRPPADCGTAEVLIRQNETPRVDEVVPLKLCHLGGSLDLFGEHFEPGMSVQVGRHLAHTVEVAADGRSATATWTQELPTGLHLLSVANPSGCRHDTDIEIRVTEGPLVFFVDPPVVYNGIALQATIYVGNLYGGFLREVALVQGAERRPLEFRFDPQKPNRVQALVPAGLNPGLWDVAVLDDVDCPGRTDGLLRVTDRLDVAVASVEPPFAWTREATSVTVVGPVPVPEEQQPFAATPRAYLNPNPAGAEDTATELRGLTFHSPSELKGIVDAGLPAGLYDLFVVNPDGGVGVLREALRVTADPPPIIDSVSPGSWQNSYQALDVFVQGRNFRTDSVEVECHDTAGQPDYPAVTVVQVLPEELHLQVDTRSIPHLSACSLRAINGDSSYVDYAPITVTNSAGKFVEFQEGPNLLVPRRGPGATDGSPSRSARFLYVFGGDDGSAQGAYASGEFAPLDRFGTPGAFAPLPAGLPRALTHFKMLRLDDFLYLLGGQDAAGQPRAEVLRARVLDPLLAPRVDSVDFEFDPAIEGLATGVYYYRVAPVFGAEDASNPNGEGLASDPQAVFVPDLPMGLRVVLEWSAVPDAVAYRVYRSQGPDEPYGGERLLGQISALERRRILDDGSVPVAGASPLPLGALGTWHQVARLALGRYLHGVTAAVDPAVSTILHLYAVGGATAPGQVLGDYELLSVSVLGPGRQIVLGNGVSMPGALNPARSELEALTIDPAGASSVPLGRSYVLALSGYGVGGASTRSTEMARILPGGTLAAFEQRDSIQPFFAGYAAAVANNNVLVAGGQQGLASTSARHALLDGACGVACDPPLIERWSSLSEVSLRARYLMGRVATGGFLYVMGGVDAADQPLETLDYTIIGGTP